MNYACFCCVACLTLAQCRSSNGSPLPSEQAAPAEMPAQARASVDDVTGSSSPPTGAVPPDPVPPASLLSVPDGGVDASVPPPAPVATFPADWCARLAGLPAAIRITNAYNAAVRGACLTAGLVAWSELSDEQYDQYEDWRSYLQDYTFLMAGCVPDYEPPEGGILVFGPGNTPLIGVPRSPLSPNEALLLVEDYVQAFASELGLTAEERDAVRAYLLQVVAAETDDPAAIGSLSTCAALDAGQ
jgi:hypothetical protein